MAKEQLSYSIDQWTEDGQNLVQYHARAKHFDVAVAAFEAVARVEPEANLAMRLGAQVLRERKGEKRKLSPTGKESARLTTCEAGACQEETSAGHRDRDWYRGRTSQQRTPPTALAMIRQTY